MIYARKKRRNVIFITKLRVKIWKYEFFVVYLRKILKRRYTAYPRKWRMGGCVPKAGVEQEDQEEKSKSAAWRV